MACSVPSIGNVKSIPFDKHEAVSSFPFGFIFGGSQPKQFRSAQAGIVQLKVLINRICPFRKSPFTDNALVFNPTTIESFPENVHRNLEGIVGLEGVSLPRRYIYRHNYILFAEPSSSGKIIAYTPLDAPEVLPLSANPKYMEHTSWVEYQSPYAGHQFDNDENKENTNCSSFPSFAYLARKVPSDIKANDQDILKADYHTKDLNAIGELPAMYQTIYQTKTQRCNRKIGVHWRLQKRTKMFQGQDFFIDFFRPAYDSDLTASSLDNTLEFTEQGTKYIDAALDASNITVTLPEAPDIPVPINGGVANYIYQKDSNGNIVLEKDEDFTDYLFTNQAYLVIEMGFCGNKHHYYIIITDRGQPLFVMEEGGVSFALSRYSAILGNALFKVSNFRVTVQNWLGKLVVRFDGEGLSLPPWIIERKEIVIATGSQGQGGSQQDKVATMFVPKATLWLWGGNLPISFIYGPLQYHHNYVLDLPPKPVIPVPTVEGDTSTDLRFALPDKAKHKITFSAQEGFPSDLLNDPAIIAKDTIYTCDAQSIVEHDEIDGIGKDSSQPSNFYGEPNYRSPGGSSPAGFAFRSELKVSKIDIGVDESRRLRTMALRIDMRSGDNVMDVDNLKDWVLKYCKNPIMTILRLVADDPPEAKRWETQCHDVTDHVMNFSEAWAAQDFNSIEHTGDITFLLNRGASYQNDQTEYLKSLVNKAFYIEVWGGYKDCNYSKLNGFWKLFTGVCFGGDLENSAGKRFMKCQINDYTAVLERQRIFNSPFFDGVKAVFALNELLRMAGFRSQPGDIDESPGALIHELTLQKDTGDPFTFLLPDGRIHYSWPYALPSSYARLTDPKFKFKDSSSYIDGIKQITKRSAKLFFFDQFGLAHFENYFDSVVQQLSLISLATSPGAPSLQSSPLFFFTSNPSLFPGQQVFNKYDLVVNVNDVKNHIKILTNTPNFTPIFVDDLEWDSIDNPDTEGFMGFFSTFYQEEGAFGSREAVNRTRLFYRTMFRPPLIVKFETYGQPIRALDIVVLDNQPYRAMKVDSQFDPSKNVWWQTIEAEWLQPALPPSQQP